MKRMVAMAILFVPFLFGHSSPVKDMAGASASMIIDEGDTANTYILNGLVNWWDGILSEFDATKNKWKDLVEGENFNGSIKGTGDFAVWDGAFASIKTENHRSISDFTLHSLVETPNKANWKNWCVIGIGDRNSMGVENGIVLSCRNNPMAVCYRSTYSGTVHNSVPLSNVNYCDTIVLDIVFHYSSLTYEVYVNGEYIGASTILSDNWNLDGKHLTFGLQFNGTTDTNRNCKMYNVMIYNRALSAEEVAHNFAIDVERFGL